MKRDEEVKKNSVKPGKTKSKLNKKKLGTTPSSPVDASKKKLGKTR